MKLSVFFANRFLTLFMNVLIAGFILLPALATQTLAQSTCESTPGARKATDFGQLVSGSTNAATIAANTATINNALQQVGSAGGGTVCLPAGTFHLAPRQISSGASAININYDNLTLWGAGAGQTILRTRSAYSVINNEVVRGNGIIINGTTNCSTPRKNITLKFFELDGGAGYTGNFGWPADPATGDGWDITHKGIILSSDRCVDNVTLENIHVHSYRGEVIYAGGSALGKVTIRNIKSEDTNGSTYNITADATVENSEFGKSRFWIEIGTAFSGKKAVFRNNYFHDSHVEGAVALAQGDLSYQPYLFENNRFEQCHNNGATFFFLGGVGGPVDIRNNLFVNCSGIFTGYAPNPAPWGRSENQNITFENNQLTNPAYLAYFFQQGSNIVVRNNTVDNTTNSPGATTSVSYCCTGWSNVLIENNSFNNVRTPEQSANLNSDERPLLRGNTYTNSDTRLGQGSYQLSSASRLVAPLFEQTYVQANAGNLEVVLNTTNYPDGQETRIEVYGDNAVKFALGAASYSVGATRTVSPGGAISFRFDKTLGKWVEFTPPANPTPTPTPTPTATPSPVPTPTPVFSTPVIAVNSGGSASGRFSADSYFGDREGGQSGRTYSTTSSINLSGVTNPAPQAVYQSERWGSPSFIYTLAGLNNDGQQNLVPGVTYLVRLHFAEIYFNSPGRRRFNVFINGQQVLSNFDIVAEAGAANKAVVKEFMSTAVATQEGGGAITITFSQGAANNPKVSGIEVLPATLLVRQTPRYPDANDGQPYELGMKFSASKAGQIRAIRYWKPASETGTHTGRIWSSTGTQLASVTFAGETASGWQEAMLATPLTITANRTYVVTVNANTNYVATQQEFSTPILNGELRSVADGNNGVYGNIGTFPTNSYQNSNYFRDVVFRPAP